jgi:hypothetical protein
MTLSADMHHLLLAYDGLTNFAGGPDLPWVLETYEQLDDSTLRNMIWAFSYAWAAGQRAAGYYHGNVECLAQALFTALPTWDDTLPREGKQSWLQRLGIDAILPELESRPTTSDCCPSINIGGFECADRTAIEDMAAHFRIGTSEAMLLYQLGQLLGHTKPIPALAEFQVNG